MIERSVEEKKHRPSQHVDTLQSRASTIKYILGAFNSMMKQRSVAPLPLINERNSELVMNLVFITPQLSTREAIAQLSLN